MTALTTLCLTACNSDNVAEEPALATTAEAIIAGVDAKSASLDMVGSLVEVYRYSVCYDCGYGGSSGIAGSSGRGGTTIVPTTVVPVPRRNPINGLLDRPPRSLSGSGYALATGGAPATTIVTGTAGRSGVGGGTSIGGSGGTGPIEIVSYYPLCSASLIGPTAVLSAKHCLMDLDYYGESVEIAFAVGPDAYNPKAVYPIIDWDWETEVPPDTSSYLADLGSDVGVAHLGTPVAGVTPLAVGSLSVADVGRRFTAVGYGLQNNNYDDGTRKAGSLTLRGIGGNYADYAFGGLEGFLKAAKTMPAFEGYPDYYLEQIYYELNLLPEYQAFLGGMRGDAQPCYGDSGGPLIAMLNGQRTVFGNVTSGFGSSRLRCDFGAVFAVFGPSTQNYLAEALSWVDPCIGTTVKGHCEGDLAVRCTNRSEGKRRLSETDCGMLGQTCGLDETGSVACVDPPAQP